jgi:hypothetical protein
METLREKEFEYQRLADAARSAQDSVTRLADVVQELADMVRDSHPEAARYAEGVLSRTPFLRKMPLTADLDGDFRYVLMIPFPRSPREKEEGDLELKYLRDLLDAQYGFTTPTRFIKFIKGVPW